MRGSGRFDAAPRQRGLRVPFQSPSLRGSGRFDPCAGRDGRRRPGFNPLHCGAVVASDERTLIEALTRAVSIPFIAGQWSLRRAAEARAEVAARFQSPSLRGSGRFSWPSANLTRRRCCFNPLHCGAVVASGCGPTLNACAAKFQSPSLRGSGRFRGRRLRNAPKQEAGFNPLHCGAVVASILDARRSAARRAGFNPLHCGAVVASSEPASATGPGSCFNPLHCGAVVASPRRMARGQGEKKVSIPFIAGQWSLQTRRAPPPVLPAAVSIPFIAGQWSLREGPPGSPPRDIVFQSPSLRGSGRFPHGGGGKEDE